LNSAGEGIYGLDLEGKGTFVNPAAAQLLGYEVKELIGQPMHPILHHSRPDGTPYPREECLIYAAFKDGTVHYVNNEVFWRKDGTNFPVEYVSTPIRERDKIVGAVVVFKNITERKQTAEMIQRLAYYDILTGLPNRTLLHDRLQQAIFAGQRGNKPLAILLMDLDRFKEINDTIGHQNGDLLLQQVGRRLQNILFKSDMVARLGGDEFAVLLPTIAAPEHTALVARKILKALEEPFVLGGLTLDVGVSIGIALSPEHGEDADLLIQRADVAMYAAKQTSSGYAVYTAEQDPHSPRRLALMSELRHAIEHGELALYYQPKIDLKAGHVIGVEALVRWNHPQRGLIPPDQFIGPAEQTGMIRPLAQWVLKEAHRQFKEWHQAKLNLPISVNLSVRNLQDPQLLDQVAGLIQASGAASSWLELELTESILMVDPARAMEVLKQLSAMGIRLSIDDFGTGYSSLGYLKGLPVHEIKIDKSFVMDMRKDKNATMIVLSIINLAHNLGLKVVAEGVEDEETRDQLAAFGCDAAQGYFWSRPIPATELSRWLTESSWGMEGRR